MPTIKELSLNRKDLFEMDPNILIEKEGFNVRLQSDDLEEHIRSLADSIKAVGVQEPLTIYMENGQPVVTNGHCRLLAVKLVMSEGVEIKSVPVRVEQRYNNEADRTLSMITRNSGKPLTPLETAMVIRKLLGYGWSIPDISTKTGYSAKKINWHMDLLSTNPEIQNLVKDGKVSATLAIKTVKEKGQEAALDILTDTVEKVAQKGKAKATAQDMEPPKPKCVNWSKYGPLLHKALFDICNTSTHGKEWAGVIVAGNELLEQIQAKIGPAEISKNEDDF